MLCAIARIDTQSREKLSALQQAAERFGITVHKIYGHITLATYMGEDDRAFIASCKEILSACTPFSVYYEKVEVLSATSIIVASLRKENALLDMHHAIAAQWGHSLDHWTNNDHWQPHTTLVYDPQIDLQVLAEAMQKEFIPFFAHVTRIEFSQVTAHGYEIVDSVDLHQRQIPACRRKDMDYCDWCNLSEEDKRFQVYESRSWSVFLSDDQDYIGRCVLVLKRHCNSMSELTDNEWDELRNLVCKVEACLKAVLGAALCNWSCLMNSFYKEAVPDPHLHIHVRPRYDKPVILNGSTYTDSEFGHHYALHKGGVIPDKDKEEVFIRLKEWLNR